MGAPAKTMDMTTPGLPPLLKASRTQNAPMAPTIPANRDQAMPEPGKVQSALRVTKRNNGASTAVRK